MTLNTEPVLKSTYANAHAKIKNKDFSTRIPWNSANFGIILNDFKSSTNWTIWK